MGALADVKREWRHFRNDEPGTRFTNHRERMKHRSRAHSAIALTVGVMLLAGGVVLLFVPGPGLLLIAFGLGLIASHWARLAAVLDRSEPRLRAVGRRAKRRWNGMTGRAKLGVILCIGACAAAGLMFMWRFVVSAYLLG